MPNLTVIEGGRPIAPNEQLARQHLRDLIIEILRALARGHDNGRRIAEALFPFTKYASLMTTSVGSLVDEVVSEMHKELATDDRYDSHRAEIEDIVIASLRLGRDLLR